MDIRQNRFIMLRDILILSFTIIIGSVHVTARPSPAYVWPLGNTTLNTEVMARLDASIPDSGQCFRFRQGYPDLPYDALKLSGDNASHVDISLDGNVTFKDISLSFMVYPKGAPQGTIVNYLYKTGNILKVSMLENYLFISFWDEYGVSVGSTALPDVLAADTWSHLVVSREFLTGRIRVFHNGELLEDLDDDFPNEIQLPSRGALRLGQSLDEPQDVFIGRVSCFQIYDVVITSADVGSTKENCLPQAWTYSPKVTMRRRFVDGEIMQCVSDGSTKVSAGCDVIGMHCLTGSNAWNVVKAINSWGDSGRDSTYFSRVSRDQIPDAQNEDLLGVVSVVNDKVCLRLCMRVLGCRAFAVGPHASGMTSCMLMDKKLQPTITKPGWSFFAVRT